MASTRAFHIAEPIPMTEQVLWDDESLLVKECINGNRLAKKVLYEKHYKMMLGVSVRYVENQHDAEDVLHEAYIKIFRSVKSFQGKSKVSSWMTRIVINECLQYLKSTNRSLVEFKDDLPDQSEDIPYTTEELEPFSCDSIVLLMNKLPLGYKTVLTLFSIDGWSHKEIAKELGINESTSRSQLVKARKAFSEILKNARS